VSKSRADQQGAQELRSIMRHARGGFWAIGVFSLFVNILMLTGPLFMLQIYDRVLGSRSEATLAALFALVAALFIIMGLLEHARGRIAGRIGASFQARLDARVFAAELDPGQQARNAGRPATGLADLEAMQRFLASPILLALFDMPWTPLFLAVIWMFHPLLFALALGGGLLLVALTLLSQMAARSPGQSATRHARQADLTAETLRVHAETVRGLGMGEAALQRWQIDRQAGLNAQLGGADAAGSYASMAKVIRFFLQSAMLGLGAWLVLQDELTGGAMIAGSILLGRALAPVEVIIGQWAVAQRARAGWLALRALLGSAPVPAARTELPRPRAMLDVQNLTVVPPGGTMAALRTLNFRLEPGQALGVIGQSGSGKSTLARALTGIWQPAAGHMRLDGAALDQFSPAALGRHIGYLPQDVVLFAGTIAENIARLQAAPDDAAVVAAAQKAGAHELILALPQGYDTPVSPGSSRLSGGQKQRIGLARAMFGAPVLLVLDEPNSNLDAVGGNALNAAIRAHKSAGGAVIIMAHRPSGIAECELVLVMENGAARAFGPRDEVLKSQLQNYNQVAPGIGAKVAE
tara:strand:- start:74 stop:1813 length:1740 start_codon:yes stop_codon:yes gene_type:complete